MGVELDRFGTGNIGKTMAHYWIKVWIDNVAECMVVRHIMLRGAYET